MHGGTAQPIEKRTTQQYSRQPSSSHRGTETDAYASARHDYDADQCPAAFTGLPPSQGDTGSVTGVCRSNSWGQSVHVCVPPALSSKDTGLCVHLLSKERRGGQFVQQQSEEVTFSLSIQNPLLSYCAGSSFLGTSGNVFLLTGGAGKRGGHQTEGGEGEVLLKPTTLVKNPPLLNI